MIFVLHMVLSAGNDTIRGLSPFLFVKKLVINVVHGLRSYFIRDSLVLPSSVDITSFSSCAHHDNVG